MLILHIYELTILYACIDLWFHLVRLQNCCPTLGHPPTPSTSGETRRTHVDGDLSKARYVTQCA
jgi:hypothetical protein